MATSKYDTHLHLICIINIFSIFVSLDDKENTQSKVPIFSNCQFPWYIYYHQNQCNATYMMLLNADLRRDT